MADEMGTGQAATLIRKTYHPPSLTEMKLIGRIAEDDGSVLYIFRKPA